MWTEIVLWRFSYLLYLRMYSREFLRTTQVLCIFILVITPVKIRPLIETFPVNGHFFVDVVTNNCFSWCFESKTNGFGVSQFLLLDPRALLELRKTVGCF